MNQPSTHENPKRIKTPKLYDVGDRAINWTVSRILKEDILTPAQAKPYSYFKKIGLPVSFQDWKMLISIHGEELFIYHNDTYYVHPQKIHIFKHAWKTYIKDPKNYNSRSIDAYCRA